MRKSLTILGFVFLILSGCKEKRPDYLEEVLKVVEINDPEPISVEDFITDIDTIRLETSDESLMTSISVMHIMDDRMYILTNKNSSVHIFDSNGRFVSKISDRGDAPDEYITISSFEVDRVNKRIVISDTFSRRIFIYDADGTHIETKQLNFHPRLILPHRNGFINIYSGPRKMYEDPEMDSYNVHYLDAEGKFISSAIEVGPPKRIDILSSFMTDCLKNGDILFQPVLSEITYKIESDNIVPLYGFLNFSRFKFLSQKEKNDFEMIYGVNDSFMEKGDQGYLLTWGSVCDLDNYVFFTFSGEKMKKYFLYYSKKTGQTILVNPENVRGDKNLAEIFLLLPKAVNGDKFYISPDIGLMDHAKDKLPEGIIKTFFEKTDFDSNPVLISFSIKFPEK